MKSEKRPLLAYGQHLFQLMAVIALIFGWRMLSVSGAAADERRARTDDVSNSGMATSAQYPVDNSQSGSNELEAQIGTTPLPIIIDEGLAPALNPRTYQPELPQHEFQTYVVQRGDTPNRIAERFGINPETLLGGNPFLSQESNLLQSSVELTILPVNGLLHDVVVGETLEGLAERYAVPLDDIVAYGPNNLTFPYRLQAGTQILVPGAVREVFVWNPPTLDTVRSRPQNGSNFTPAVQGTGTYVWPITSRYFTQYYWYGHKGIDVALPEGSPLVASDTGTVTFAGWNTYGYGNLIVVNHGNGYETFYAHLSGINVVSGQVVYQGNVIGSTGNTGNSTGPHLHFEVRLNGNQDDPCWYISC